MLDIKIIRQNPKKIKEGCKAKQIKVDVDQLLELDKKRRKHLKEAEDLKAKVNHFSSLISKEKDLNKRKALIKEAKRIKIKIKNYENFLKKTNPEFEKLLLSIPNMPLDDVPVGKDDKDNKVFKKWGKIPKFSFKHKDHLELGENLDLIDVERASKISGSRFSFLKREMVLIEFALIKFVLENLIKEKFIPILPPVMLKKEMARGTGYFESADEKEAYFIPGDNLYLVGTAEQSLISMHAKEIFEEEELPRRYVGFSTCFRREAGAWGKDTRGIFRVHQFDKIEMISFCKPEDSKKEHQTFLKMEEKFMQSLKIPYQVVKICTGDLGFPAAAKYDIEAWFPGQNRYRETHSTSNCTDFQSRRLNIRYRDNLGKLNFVHTANGTAFAIGRILLAIMENYQQKDGSIKIPEVLQKYLDFKVIKR